jgi:hypothetical protein
MTLAKQFALAVAEKPKASNPVHQRRHKFIAAVDKQLTALTDCNSTVLSRKYGSRFGT